LLAFASGETRECAALERRACSWLYLGAAPFEPERVRELPGLDRGGNGLRGR